MQYKKEALTFAEQLEQLDKRGLTVMDAQRAMRYLERVGYYRLMGYLYPFRKVGGDDFIAHGRHDDPVPEGHAPQGVRFEKGRHGDRSRSRRRGMSWPSQENHYALSWA